MVTHASIPSTQEARRENWGNLRPTMSTERTNTPSHKPSECTTLITSDKWLCEPAVVVRHGPSTQGAKAGESMLATTATAGMHSPNENRVIQGEESCNPDIQTSFRSPNSNTAVTLSEKARPHPTPAMLQTSRVPPSFFPAATIPCHTDWRRPRSVGLHIG